jgi:hypothetical protein
MLFAMYELTTLPAATFDVSNPEKLFAAVGLSYARMAILVVAFFAYPIVFFSSLKYAKHVTIALTAWAIAMYIDDYLVL